LIEEVHQINELVAGCKLGDRQAQEKFYRRFYKGMMNLCLRYTKNNMDAMEALNTGFYKVFKNFHLYDPSRSAIYTWVRAIIVNSCLDQLKSRKDFIRVVELDPGSDIEIAPEIVSQLSAAHLLGMVRLLPVATQAVFNLFIVEGFSHKEIAGMLNISEGTSKWHLSDARKKLQQMITSQQP
jgi:RNA polymerase sigma factor (sigma-70 family)